MILKTKLKPLVDVESFSHEIWTEGVLTKVGFDIKNLITPLKSLCNCEPVENQYDIKLIIVENQYDIKLIIVENQYDIKLIIVENQL